MLSEQEKEKIPKACYISRNKPNEGKMWKLGRCSEEGLNLDGPQDWAIFQETHAIVPGEGDSLGFYFMWKQLTKRKQDE